MEGERRGREGGRGGEGRREFSFHFTTSTLDPSISIINLIKRGNGGGEGGRGLVGLELYR